MPRIFQMRGLDCLSKRTRGLAIVAALIVAAALMQSARATESTNRYMAMTFDQLLDVNVYGVSRYEQKITEAPASVSIITSEDIKKFGYRDLADVLRSVRGVSTSYDRSYTTLGVRGFNSPGDYNSRVLFLINGHRVNENIYESAYIGQEALIAVDDIERVEVIRGPSSSIYGNNAFLGVVNVVPKRGASLNGFEISSESGSSDMYRARTTFGKQFTNGVELFVSGSIYSSRGDEHLSYPEYNSPATGHGIARNSDEEQALNLLSSLTYHDLSLMFALNARDKNVPAAPFGAVFGTGKDETTDIHGFVDLKYEHQFEGDNTVMARAYGDAYRYYAASYYDYSAGTDPPVYNKDKARGDWAGSEVQWTKRLFDRHTIVAGAEFRENFRASQLNYDYTPRAIWFTDNEESRNVGVYGQADVAVRTNILLSAGVRYDWFSSFGDSVNPRFGLIYEPIGGTTFKLLYGRAFRAPNRYELAFNEQLRAEKINTYEFVHEQALPQNHKLTTSLYRYDVDGLITQLTTRQSNVTFGNVREVQGTGLEVGLEGNYSCGARARASYALQEAEDGDGEELSNSPRHLGRFNLSVPLYRDKIFAGIELQYHGEVLTLQRHTLDDFFLLNLTLYSREIVKNLEFSASLYNVLDTRYSFPGRPTHLQDAIEQDGRSFRVKLTYRF